MVNASIITIGDELLIGQVVDTNSAWMSKELNKIGVWVKRKVAVGDNYNDIRKALDDESQLNDIILMTGGLGPTADDITKPLLCVYFGSKLVINEAALENIRNIFSKSNRPLIERNIQQAAVPDNCTVIQNKRGTAPGMWFKKNNKIFISLPGVPHEMKAMMKSFVLPRLEQHFKLPAIISRTLLVSGIGEGFLAEHIKSFEAALPPSIKLAYLPGAGMIRLRLTATGPEKDAVEKDVQSQFEMLKELVSDYLVTDKDEPINSVVGQLLKSRNKTLATAESCTGGYIAHLLTSKSGASAFYKGSVISYANDVKENVLQVPHETLQTAGAVSEETVTQMAKSARQLLNTDYAVAVSGIMGPEGGTELKPVGLVWIAVAGRDMIRTHQYTLRFDRLRNIELTAHQALNLLRKFILEEQPVTVG